MTRRTRRCAAALTATLLTLAPLAGTLGGSAASAVAAPPAPLAVTLAGVRPIAPQPGQDVVLTGTVRNTTPAAISNVVVQPHLGGQVGSRSAFDDYADTPDGDVSDLPDIGTATPLAHPRLAGGTTEAFTVTLPAQELSAVLPASSWQVSELGLVASGATATGLSESGTLRTFLPWAPRTGSGGTPIEIAWVWPLVDRPHRTAGNVWLDDDLAPELGGQGRLNVLLDAGNAAEHPPAPRATARHHHHKPAPAGVPVTWAVDPMLLQDASLMSKGYTVRPPGGHASTGTGRNPATSWLSTLHSALDGEQVLGLPYGDDDQVAAVRGDLAGEAGVAAAAGRLQLRAALPTSQLLGTDWPVSGFADQRTLDAMFSAGYTSVLLSSSALPIVGGQPSETPSARTAATDNGELNTVLFDAGITNTVDVGANNPAQSPLELQRFLAETLMIQAEAPSPSNQRSLVVAPGRRWRPGPAYANALLADSARVPWLQPVTLSRVLSSPPDTAVTRGPLDYPSSARRAELRPAYLQQLRALKSQLAGFATVLTAGTGTISSYDAALQRLLSSAYRYDTAARNTALSSFRTTLTSQMNQVKIATRKGSYITLTSHNGKVPITVSNGLAAPVRVIVKVDENQRLAVPNGGRTRVMTIPANTQVSVALSAVAKTSGVFPMQVRLLTPGRQRYGPAVQLYVRSTAYGTITLVITAGATAALLVAVGIRLTRRALNARRATRAPA